MESGSCGTKYGYVRIRNLRVREGSSPYLQRVRAAQVNLNPEHIDAELKKAGERRRRHFMEERNGRRQESQLGFAGGGLEAELGAACPANRGEKTGLSARLMAQASSSQPGKRSVCWT